MAQLQVWMQLMRSPASRRFWEVLALSITLIITTALQLTQRLRKLNEGARWVARSERVRYERGKILQILSELGAGITLYRPSHDARLLEPAESAEPGLESELNVNVLVDQREFDTRQLREQSLNGYVAAVRTAIAAGCRPETHVRRARTHNPYAGRRVAPPGSATPLEGRLNVLIADDYREGAEILGMLVNEFGCEVALAFNGDDAFESAIDPDIAILDIGMPGLSVYEAAQQTRAYPRGSRMRLIGLKGWGQEDDKRSALEAGFVRHLIKPVDPDGLDAALKAPVAA